MICVVGEDKMIFKKSKLEIPAGKHNYNKYINNIISPDYISNPKRFWGFINRKDKDSTGIAPLKAFGGLILPPKLQS